MLDVLLWLIAVEAAGLVAFPLCYYLLPRLADRGYSVSKPLGILMLGYLSWILSVLHILPAVQATLVALFLILAGISGWYAWRRRRELIDFFVRERKTLLIAEAVFLSAFVVWAVYRAYDPNIDHTEQPMDFMYLNASVRSFLGAPEDPWLRGESVSYYYFGYWMMGALTELTGIASNVSYNLAMALIPALAAMGMFGLVYNVVREDSRRLSYAVTAGIGAALLLVVAANLEGVLEFMRANGMGSSGFWDWVGVDGLDGSAASLTETWRPQEHMWWWRATRVISTFDGAQQLDYTIQEFPSFSFILGDLHPHVMSVPFVILFLALSWNFLRSPLHVWWPLTLRGYVTIAALGFVLAGVSFTNIWDLPVFSALIIGLAAVKAASVHGGSMWALARVSMPYGAAVIGVAALLLLPYLLTFFSGQVSGIAPVGAYPAADPPVVVATTRLLHLLIVWALLLVAVVPFVLVVFWRTTVRADWARLSLVAFLVGFAPLVVWAFWHLERGGTSSDVFSRFSHVLPLALLIVIAVYSALWLAREDRSSTGKVFMLVLSALGLMLIMGPELLYVDDTFGGALERMNTVFKLYYQGWIVLTAVSGFAIYYWRSLMGQIAGWRRLLARLWAAAFVLLVVGSAYYPLAAAATKGRLFHDSPTLNGLDFLARTAAAEYDAILHIREVLDRDSAVLESVGSAYWVFRRWGLVSATTGVPTVLGWPGHEQQWRGGSSLLASGEFERREQDVSTIYRTQDIEEAKNLLARYRVEYVYIGPREREKYGDDGLGKFSSFMDKEFSGDGVILYKIRP